MSLPPDPAQPILDVLPPIPEVQPEQSVDVHPFKRGWLKGSRKLYLSERVPTFRERRRKGKSAGREYIDTVFNAFCVIYPWWLPMNQEPDRTLVYEEDMLPPAMLGAKSAFIARLTTGVYNYFEKGYNKAEPITKMTKAQISKNPVASLLAKVGDVKLRRLRGRTAAQMYSSSMFPSLRDEFNQEFAETGKDRKKERVEEAAETARKAFKALNQDEKAYWEKMAQEDAAEVARGKDNASQTPGRLSPEATQEALDGLANTMQPLLEGLASLLGGNVSFFWAGPEPQRGGQVNVVSLHVGSDRSVVPQTFATAGGERGKRRRKVVEAAMGEFAMECYTYADQEARALPDTVMSTSLPSFMRGQNSWNVSDVKDENIASSSLEMTSATPGEKTALGARSPSLCLTSEASLVSKRANTDINAPRKRRRTEKSRKEPSTEEERTASDSSDSDDDDKGGGNVVPSRSPRPARERAGRTQTLLSRSASVDSDSAIDPALRYANEMPLALDALIPTCGPLDSSHPDVFPPLLPSPCNGKEITPLGDDTAEPLSRDIPVTKKVTRKQSPLKTLIHAEAYLRSFLLSVPGWQSLLVLYVASETGGKWTGKPLPSRNRPAYIHLWLQNARGIEPELPSAIRDVANGFWLWWITMQPDWRNLANDDFPLCADHRPSVVGGSWGALQTRGLNGHFTTLSFLAWWGRACGNDLLDLEEWSAAVEDVSWVLKHVYAS